VETLPKICDDPWELWDLLLRAYGSEVFTPMIIAKFPAQFSGDMDEKRNSLKLLKSKFKSMFDDLSKRSKQEIERLKV
jgi:hypothetical protein